MGDVEELKAEVESLTAAIKDVAKKNDGQKVVFVLKHRKLGKSSSNGMSISQYLTK